MIDNTPAWRRRVAREFATLLLENGAASVDRIDLSDIPSDRRKAIVGPIVLDFAERGFIADTGEFERSKRPHAHQCPKRIWQLRDDGGLRRWRRTHRPLSPAPEPITLF